MVPAGPHPDLLAGAAHHHHPGDGRRILESLVGNVLQRHDPAAPVAAVGGDQHLGLGVVDPVAERLSGKAGEDHAVGRPDPGAGEHRDRKLRDHRQVDRHPVALLDPEAAQNVGEAADLPVEVGVGQGLFVPRLAFPEDRRTIPAPPRQVPVQAVDARVQLSADEPAGEGRLPVEDLVPPAGPVKPLRLGSPKRFRIGLRLPVDGLVPDPRLVPEVVRGRIDALLIEQHLNFLFRDFLFRNFLFGLLGHRDDCRRVAAGAERRGFPGSQRNLPAAARTA